MKHYFPAIALGLIVAAIAFLIAGAITYFLYPDYSVLVATGAAIGAFPFGILWTNQVFRF